MLSLKSPSRDRFDTQPLQSSILVDNSGCAHIADFGTVVVAQDQDRAQSVLDEHPGWWTAPEILNEHGTYSKEADIFSFAMVVFEARYD